MTARLDGRVAIVTGAGRGLGAEYALMLARHGARVVVNDLGSGSDGDAADADPASEVVDQIRATGGEAVADDSDVASWDGAAALLDRALTHFGDVDILVNNAGILRDRMLFNMSVEEWDAVMRVHLRGHFCATRHVVAHWRQQVKDGDARDRVLVHTTSTSGLLGSIGQTNYGAAKSGVAMFSLICDMELRERYGIRSYAVAPGARTRLTLQTPDARDIVQKPDDAEAFDYWDPANVAAFVAWLATPDCRAASGSIFHVRGDAVTRYEPWRPAETIEAGGHQWEFEELDCREPELFAEARHGS